MRILLTPRTPTSSPPLALEPARVQIRSRPLRVLDFDCECRPLHWISNDYVSREITAIAWAWCDEPDQTACVLLGEMDPVTMLAAFRAAYDQADLVTGHFIRGFDLPLINGAMLEYGLPRLKDKLTQDTKLDLARHSGLSKSQENIAATLKLEHPKVRMNQAKWREANRLTPEGLAAARQRVTGDVQQHIEMRRRLLELGYLAPPVLWRSGSVAAQEPEYTP